MANPSYQPVAPYYQAGAGIRTEFGTVIPPGSNAFFVRSTGASSQDPPEIAKRIDATLDAAMLKCRSGYNDYIFILPGHTENVSSTFLADLVAGTRIIGIGDPMQDNAPTFTWNATGSTMAISVKNVVMSGLRFIMDGANGVTAPINITASGTQIRGCYMRWSNGASNLATTAITVGSGATDTIIADNFIYGVAAGVCTDGIKLLGATTPDRTQILRNRIVAACTSATGVINVTVAAKGLLIEGNSLENVTASSIAAITFANVACDGVMRYNDITVKSTGAQVSGTTGITIGGASALVGFAQNFVVNDVSKSAILQPAADT